MEQEKLQRLKEIVDILKENPQIKWTDSGVNGGVLTLPYPIYPSCVHDLICIIPHDHHYDVTLKKIKRKKILIDSYNYNEVIAHLTYIFRRERFCDGFIAVNIDDGTLLELLKKLIILT